MVDRFNILYSNSVVGSKAVVVVVVIKNVGCCCRYSLMIFLHTQFSCFWTKKSEKKRKKSWFIVFFIILSGQAYYTWQQHGFCFVLFCCMEIFVQQPIFNILVLLNFIFFFFTKFFIIFAMSKLFRIIRIFGSNQNRHQYLFFSPT